MTRSTTPNANQPNGPLQLKYPTGTEAANPKQKGKPLKLTQGIWMAHATLTTDTEACPHCHEGVMHCTGCNCTGAEY